MKVPLVLLQGILLNNDYAIDCGAGIGRVTKHLLMPLFKKVSYLILAIFKSLAGDRLIWKMSLKN